MVFKGLLLSLLVAACAYSPKEERPRRVEKPLSLQDVYEMGSQENVEMFEVSTLIFTFDPNSSELKAQDRKSLDDLIFEIKKNQKQYQRIQIVGHSDQTGTDDLNLDLSKERALAVRSTMKDAGIKRSKVQTSWLASTEPLTDDQDAAVNRRVEIKIFRVKK